MRKSPGLWLLVTILAINLILGFGLQFYKKYESFDIILHFLGGWAIYLILADYFSSVFSTIPIRYQHFFWLAGVALAGVIWELTEYSAGQLWGTGPGSIEFIGNLDDTISDLGLDLLGGIWGIGFHWLSKRNSKKI